MPQLGCSRAHFATPQAYFAFFDPEGVPKSLRAKRFGPFGEAPRASEAIFFPSDFHNFGRGGAPRALEEQHWQLLLQMGPSRFVTSIVIITEGTHQE